LNIRVQDAEKLSLEEIRRFVEASEAIRFAGEKREQVYGWIERVLLVTAKLMSRSVCFEPISKIALY
jgi:hypothetical protein